MRTPVALLIALALAGCSSDVDRGLADEDMGGGGGGTDGSGSGEGQVPEPNCVVDSDCVTAGPRCCDCPTHAVPMTDPSALACADVDCGPMSCGSPTEAACQNGHCELVCSPVACDPTITCDSGFAVDTNGCLTCQCAGTAAADAECTVDTDCVRVRADCCGCDQGGTDTAVPVGQAGDYDASLMCPSSPSCPGGNSCPADLSARCVQGACALVEGTLPANACGRADLMACLAGQFCTVNANDLATMQGVGVCQP